MNEAAIQWRKDGTSDSIDYVFRNHGPKGEDCFEEAVCANGMAFNFVRHNLKNYEYALNVLRCNCWQNTFDNAWRFFLPGSDSHCKVLGRNKASISE